MTSHFARKELQCKCGCGLANFHPGFLDKLEELRVELDEPMSLTSACRCTTHNIKVGGHERSLHIGDNPQHSGQGGTLAIDVATPNAAYRGRLVAIAWILGWSIGWGGKKGFVHLDRRDMVGLSQTTFDY